MSLLLSLDIGTKKTGAALGDTDTGVVFALDTITHASVDELLTKVDALVKARNVSKIIVGLPRLLSGEEGSQAAYVRGIADALKAQSTLEIEFCDERFTSLGQKSLKNNHAKAACEILFSVMESQKEDN